MLLNSLSPITDNFSTNTSDQQQLQHKIEQTIKCQFDRNNMYQPLLLQNMYINIINSLHINTLTIKNQYTYNSTVINKKMFISNTENPMSQLNNMGITAIHRVLDNTIGDHLDFLVADYKNSQLSTCKSSDYSENLDNMQFIADIYKINNKKMIIYNESKITVNNHITTIDNMICEIIPKCIDLSTSEDDYSLRNIINKLTTPCICVPNTSNILIC